MSEKISYAIGFDGLDQSIIKLQTLNKLLNDIRINGGSIGSNGNIVINGNGRGSGTNSVYTGVSGAASGETSVAEGAAIGSLASGYKFSVAGTNLVNQMKASSKSAFEDAEKVLANTKSMLEAKQRGGLHPDAETAITQAVVSNEEHLKTYYQRMVDKYKSVGIIMDKAKNSAGITETKYSPDPALTEKFNKEIHDENGRASITALQQELKNKGIYPKGKGVPPKLAVDEEKKQVLSDEELVLQKQKNDYLKQELRKIGIKTTSVKGTDQLSYTDLKTGFPADQSRVTGAISRFENQFNNQNTSFGQRLKNSFSEKKGGIGSYFSTGGKMSGLPAEAGLSVARFVGALSPATLGLAVLALDIYALKKVIDLAIEGIQIGADAYQHAAKTGMSVGRYSNIANAFKSIGMDTPDLAMLHGQFGKGDERRMNAPGDANVVLGAARAGQMGEMQQLTNMSKEFMEAMNEGAASAQQMAGASKDAQRTSSAWAGVTREWTTLLAQLGDLMSPILRGISRVIEYIFHKLNFLFEMVLLTLKSIPGSSWLLGGTEKNDKFSGGVSRMPKTSLESMGFVLPGANRSDDYLAQISRNTAAIATNTSAPLGVQKHIDNVRHTMAFYA
jgi:hypothetical protein